MQSQTLTVVVGLGANLGEPRQQLEDAVRALAALGTVQGVSGLFASAAVGGPPQPDYLNAAVLLSTGQTLEGLLQELFRVERAAGRERRVRWGPRTLDLDILWARGATLEAPGLSVPHPRLHERAFALLPLVEVAPDAIDQRTGARYADCAAHVAAIQSCERVSNWSNGAWLDERFGWLPKSATSADPIACPSLSVPSVDPVVCRSKSIPSGT